MSTPETPDKRRALGRGLDALLPSRPPDAPAAATTSPAPGGKSPAAFMCPIERIEPQRGQPRQTFDDARIEELSASIRDHGLIEPIVVRRLPSGAAPAGGTGASGAGASGAGGSSAARMTGDRYEIIAGERRWRAAQRAGLHELLVVVKDVAPRAAFELALVENVQREDLNPIELAEAFDRLVREHGYTQETLGDLVHKDRATVANSLRLLKLPPRVRSMVISGALTEGHARALLGAPSATSIESLAEKVARGGLSVRATEKLVRAVKPGTSATGDGAKTGKSVSVRDLEAKLSRHLGARAEIRPAADGKRGELAIRYGSLDELDGILEVIFR